MKNRNILDDIINAAVNTSIGDHAVAVCIYIYMFHEQQSHELLAQLLLVESRQRVQATTLTNF